MANNRIEMVDSNTNSIKQTDCFIHCDIPHATNEGLSTSESHKFFNKILKYLMRSTARIVQSKKKKFNIRKRSASTSCKSEEKNALHTSLSSIANNIIKSDVQAVAKKRKTIDAITSTTSEIFDKVTHKNLPCAIEHFVHGTPYRYAEYAAKYVENAVQERGCGPLCIGTQSDIVDGEFSLETSPDAFAKACEKRRHKDFILEKIAKVSDALIEKSRFDSAKKQAASILASVSATSATKYEMGKETFECTKPLISSIMYAKEKPTALAITASATTIMHPEMFTQVLVSSSRHCMPDSRDFSTCLDKSLSDIQIIPSIKHLRKTDTRTVSVMYPERDDLRDAIRKKKKEEQRKLSKKISLQKTLDKHVFVDETSYAAVNSIITNCIPKLRKSKLKSLDQPNDTKLKHKITTVQKELIDSSIEISQVKKKPTRITKEILRDSRPYEKPKYRAKYRIDASYVTKEEKMLQLKKIPKDDKIDKIPKYGCLLPSPSQALRTSKFFSYFEKPVTGICKDYRSISSRCLQPTKHCKDLIPYNLCLEKPKYCNVWTTPCCSSQIEATRNASLSYADCRLPQDSCATQYRASCHSLVDSHATSRHCNINADCTKRFENSLYTNMYCKSDTKYCYPHLNDIDNIRMGYYQCNDSAVWNNNQHCGRDRPYYWTKGNLYFAHPWTSKHLLRFNGY